MVRMLDDGAVRAGLDGLDGWSLRDGKLRREIDFGDFSAAFGFLSRVALLAEKHGHHPDIHNSYGRVVLELVSHDAGGITERDLALARAIHALS